MLALKGSKMLQCMRQHGTFCCMHQHGFVWLLAANWLWRNNN